MDIDFISRAAGLPKPSEPRAQALTLWVAWHADRPHQCVELLWPAGDLTGVPEACAKALGVDVSDPLVIRCSRD